MTDEQETIGADMAALTNVLPGPDGPLPLLILDQRPEMAVRSGPAERVKLFVSALRSMGLTLVTTISEAGSGTPDVIEVSEPLALAPGWRLELSADRAARLTAPDGSVIYSGECGQPRPWRADHPHQPVRRANRRDRPVPQPRGTRPHPDTHAARPGRTRRGTGRGPGRSLLGRVLGADPEL